MFVSPLALEAAAFRAARMWRRYYGAIAAFASAEARGINRMFKRLRGWDEAMEGSS